MQDTYGAARSAGYGDYGGTSEYGHERYVDCNSALALIGFILFVDILRDIIESIIKQKEAAAAAGRKKRWTAKIGNEWNGISDNAETDVFTFISEDGIQHFYLSVPDILLPALEGWWELNDPRHHEHCLQQSICQTNYVLATDYGITGRIIATLFSNVVSHAVSGGEPKKLKASLAAAKSGRRKNICEEEYPKCNNLPVQFQQLRYRNKHQVLSKKNPNIFLNRTRDFGD